MAASNANFAAPQGGHIVISAEIAILRLRARPTSKTRSEILCGRFAQDDILQF
jgi:hypothetical protein